METNKLYALHMLLDLSSSAVIQARQCLTEELISKQLLRKMIIQLPKDTTEILVDIYRNNYLNGQSFDYMIQTGDEIDAALAETLCIAEIQIENYLKVPNQPRY